MGTENMVVKSSASIKPGWVARWGFREPPCEELTAAGVRALAEIKSVRENWDVGAFQIELKPGFGPEGPIGKCEEWCGADYIDSRVPGATQWISPDHPGCFTASSPGSDGDQSAYCTQACLDRAQAKVAVDESCAGCGRPRPSWVKSNRLCDVCRAAQKKIAAPTCQAPGWCSTACWRVQRHVETVAKVPEEWRAPKHDIIPWADDRIHSARPDAATFSKVAALPPMPIDSSRELAHMVPRWSTKRYER